MLKHIKKTKNISKGAPSGVIISLMVHAAAFLVAGLLVVFTVHQKEEKTFTPPKPVDRPKMKLKKPQVKVKKSAKPKSTTRIVTNIKRASMPDIQLPEMSGMGDGFDTGVGSGFEIMSDLNELTTLLGGSQTIGNDFEGTFYDLKRTRSGRTSLIVPDAVHYVFYDFLQKGWKKSVFSRYYQSPNKKYTTTFMVPPVRTNLAPEIFNEDTEGWGWAVHFTGELVHHEDIKFRFWGCGIPLMAVRVDRELVLLCYWEREDRIGSSVIYGNLWESSAADNRKYPLGSLKSFVGDWIELKANEPLKMEVLYGSRGGGVFEAMLCVEVEGVEYPRSPYLGGPILPIFKTSPLTRDARDVIGASLYPGFGSMTNGPVFRDYGYNSTSQEVASHASDTIESLPEPQPEPIVEKMRVWTMTDGEEFEAEYVVRSGDQLWMQSPNGQKQKVPMKMLSPEDLHFIELLEPPDFQIEFSKISSQRREPPNQTEVDTTRPIRRFNFVFGAKVMQKGMRPYHHPLTIEYFAVGDKWTATISSCSTGNKAHSLPARKIRWSMPSMAKS